MVRFKEKQRLSRKRGYKKVQWKDGRKFDIDAVKSTSETGGLMGSQVDIIGTGVEIIGNLQRGK